MYTDWDEGCASTLHKSTRLFPTKPTKCLRGIRVRVISPGPVENTPHRALLARGLQIEDLDKVAALLQVTARLLGPSIQK